MVIYISRKSHVIEVFTVLKLCSRIALLRRGQYVQEKSGRRTERRYIRKRAGNITQIITQEEWVFK